MLPCTDFSSFSISPCYLILASWDNTQNMPNYTQVLASGSALWKPKTKSYQILPFFFHLLWNLFKYLKHFKVWIFFKI